MLCAAAAAAVTSTAPVPNDTRYSRPVTVRLAYFSGTCSQRCRMKLQGQHAQRPCNRFPGCLARSLRPCLLLALSRFTVQAALPVPDWALTAATS